MTFPHPDPSQEDTQPLRAQGETRPVPVRTGGDSARQPGAKPPAGRRRPVLLLLAAGAVLVLLLAAAGGALAGYGSGMRTRQAWAASQAVQSLEQQYGLALEDMSAGRYDLARQRLEYILELDPAYPEAAGRLAEAMAILYATATPTPPPPPTPTITLTPTRDLRPVQEIFEQARQAYLAQDWSAAIDLLNGLRKEDPDFETARVDGMLYIALRSRGVGRILNGGDLQGGSYDLALAERFAPLDGEAEQVRNLARLFMYGNAFWEAYPEQAVFYFSQVAAAAPYLSDGTGWTASGRYIAALVQYGDALARQELWCDAQAQYDLAGTMGGNASLQATAQFVADQCAPPTETPTPTLELTLTASPTVTPTWTLTLAPPSATTAAPVTETVQPTTAVPTTQVPAATTQAPVATTPVVEPTTAVPATTEPPTQEPPTQEPPTETPPPPATTEPPPVPSQAPTGDAVQQTVQPSLAPEGSGE